MLIGLVSDTHDNTVLARQAASFFHGRAVDQVFHLGDVTQPETLDGFEGLPLVVVRGNYDDEPWPDTWTQELAGVKLGATHGHLRGHMTRLARECDVLLHGHTHARRAVREGSCLVVNPGALYRTTTHTCALLELPSLKVVFYRVEPHRVSRL